MASLPVQCVVNTGEGRNARLAGCYLGFAKLIIPLLFMGVMIAVPCWEGQARSLGTLTLDRSGSWRKTTLWAQISLPHLRAFMYFATLTEVQSYKGF